MTPQENQLLNDLVNRVRETRLTEKDPEAEQLLREGLSTQPDATYILAQTALVQNIALQQAGAQIEQLKQQLQQAQQQAQQPARATSFLGSLLGRHEESQTPPPTPPQQRPGFTGQPQYQQQQPQYQPVAAPAAADYPAQGYPAQPMPQPVAGGGGSSFLRSAATTAAGVAAGALAFEGIESLFRGMSHPSGFGYGGGGFGSPVGMGGFGSAPVEETIVNNYYDSPDPNREHHEREASYDERPGGHEPLDRAQYDPNGSSAHMENASYDPGRDNTQDDSDLQTDDDNSYDDDDSGSDDLSDDGGDSSGGDDSSFV